MGDLANAPHVVEVDVLRGTMTEVSTGNALDGMTWVDGEYVDCLPLAMIAPWEGNPRKSFDEQALLELAASISAQGVQQPILVRYVPEQSKLSIVMGESRWRASKMAGKATIPAKIRVGMSDRTALELALTENVQRKDLTALESAEAMRRLVDMGARQTDLARRLGIAESTISNALRTLSLPPAVIDLVRVGKLEMSVAKSLTRFAKWPDAVTRIAELLTTELGRWSVRDVESSLPGAYTLQKENLLRQIDSYSTEFDWKANCIDCPFGAYYEQSKHTAYCFRPAHYNQLQKEAKDAKNAQQQSKLAKAINKAQNTQDDSKLPRLAEFAHGACETMFDDKRPPGCSLDCPCAARAINYTGEVVAICSDTKRLKKLRAAETRDKKKTIEQEAEALIMQMTAMMDSSAERVPLMSRGLGLALARMMRDIGYQSQRPFKLAAPHVSDPVIRQIFAAGTKDLVNMTMAASVAESLSQRPYTQIADAIALLLFCEKLSDWIDNPETNKPNERIKLLLGEEAL